MSHELRLDQPGLLRTRCLIDGQWVDADHSKTFSVTDPATGRALADVPAMGAAETMRAIAAAEHAWTGWRGKTAKERAAVLRRWYELILSHTEDLARILTAEQGKPLTEARNEIGYAAGFVEWFAEEAGRAYGETIPSPVPDKRLLVIRQPIGVCAAITPWNFPAAMITRKIAPALAAGCTVVVKPAEQTPLTALALADLAVQAGFPPGVINVVTGDPEAIGGELTSNPLIRKLSFTGSTEVGRLLMAQCAATVKKISLELGGNAPFIVFEDADLDAAVEGALLSKYRNTGQTCVCTNRFLIQDSIYDAFAERLAAKVRRLEVGNGLDEGVVQGPLIDEQALAKVERHIADALDRGARVLAGGGRHPLGGRFFQPTVLVDVTPEMLCTREETFGPVAPLLRFGSEEEALAIANATEYGLAAYFYTRDLARAFRVGEALEYGMVGINTGMLSYDVAPFGGVKQSGIGREGSHHGMDEYLELKYLCLGGMAPSA
ncbi:NAD-dependent succinate-semialdehyde dehydrogenase [Methylococcus capsulatus]|jgi:succinate-semialdehyde dehydrogenase/glutarate-semialdehyde dehydrogenase|uniref:Succinate-semialdehyde dehydrogenase (NADP+) n=1 Tax=Methylococcus capsulatus (strain ATCC 33009 / NCIMB 11132 / Bath) TaxID=243233 RepID=Q607K3_METCA|nr:NAD-dependent succinate-semialdehyde dehydrogenase [Methylococcus capsulatus]AAU92267.1 succinate-semialdehyde dehydrogenase (NADP+) [Methylococcus capsulatus str. Bath]QXP91054.1 NAD-dependent succinate-semialdehyde dehydrogenase [Methylococcus capsulatus]